MFGQGSVNAQFEGFKGLAGLVSWVELQDKSFEKYSKRSKNLNERKFKSGIGLHLRTSPLKKLTQYLKQTYSGVNSSFHFEETVPRRTLTVPSEIDECSEHDNIEGNLVCHVNDTLESLSIKYTILDILGQGTFGQVFRCQDPLTKAMLAIKVIKNRPAFHNQAKLEIQILCFIREKVDPQNKKHLVRMLDYFLFKNHICMVFELLSINLYELLRQNKFRGLPLPIVQHFTKQIMESLAALEAANIMHCDLKPENILLVAKDRPQNPDQDSSSSDMEPSNKKRGKSINEVKLIDFGSACYEGNTMYTYIQSRFYRSPEVLIGLPYDGAIDVWSLGCICGEMFLGLPLFPGMSDYDLMSRIVEMVGAPPDWMVEEGKDASKYFDLASGQEADISHPEDSDCFGIFEDSIIPSAVRTSRPKFILKTAEEFAKATSTEVVFQKKWFKFSKLEDILESYPHRQGMSSAELYEANEARKVFIHFIMGLLQPDPWKRWTPQQALTHPFLTGKKLEPGFDVPWDPKTEYRKRRLFKPAGPSTGLDNSYHGRDHLERTERNLSFTQLNQMYGAMHLSGGPTSTSRQNMYSLVNNATDPINLANSTVVSPGSNYNYSQNSSFSLGTLINQSGSLGGSLSISSFLAGSLHDPRDNLGGHHLNMSRPFGGQEPFVSLEAASRRRALWNGQSNHDSISLDHKESFKPQLSRNVSDSSVWLDTSGNGDPEGWPMSIEERPYQNQLEDTTCNTPRHSLVHNLSSEHSWTADTGGYFYSAPNNFSSLSTRRLQHCGQPEGVGGPASLTGNHFSFSDSNTQFSSVRQNWSLPLGDFSIGNNRVQGRRRRTGSGNISSPSRVQATESKSGSNMHIATTEKKNSQIPGYKAHSSISLLPAPPTFTSGFSFGGPVNESMNNRRYSGELHRKSSLEGTHTKADTLAQLSPPTIPQACGQV